MSELNAFFRQRIGFPANVTITFEMLDRVLEKTAQTIPFENFCVIENKMRDITKESLIHKIVVNKEGGLCYELNALFYLFLIDNGFQAVLTRGVVYNHDMQAYSPLDRTHVTILLAHEGQTYVVDTGFGGNLPLTPVPLTGETVTSANGDFRIRKVNSERGQYALEMKLKHKDTDWRIGYAFDAGKPVTDLSELTDIQSIIAANPASPFNKHPLITMRTERGNMTLTSTSFTQWNDGHVAKEQVDHARFRALLKQHFGR